MEAIKVAGRSVAGCRYLALSGLALVSFGCDNGSNSKPEAQAEPPGIAATTPISRGGDAGTTGHWAVVHDENFEMFSLPSPRWVADAYPADGPFADNGDYFQNKGITPPSGFRISSSAGQDGWLTIESYSRSNATPFSELVSVAVDPEGSSNHVLRLASPKHTDATVVRPTQPLPERYRVSLRVGYASFGDGLAGGRNGYDGGERAEPWLNRPATDENGFYWLAILDSVPRPHNNVWIHHHRKIVIDSDNHFPPWMELDTGAAFVSSGEMPVMLFAVDGRGKGYELSGKPFLSYAAGIWQPSGTVRALNGYKPRTWYSVSIERNGDIFRIQLSGDFRFGGARTYAAMIDAAEKCVWHYNNLPLEATSPCIDTTTYPSSGTAAPNWPSAQIWPDYFMFGDPHTNYYEGEVFYDDLRLEIWQ